MNEILQVIGFLAAVIVGAYLLWWILTRGEARRARAATHQAQDPEPESAPMPSLENESEVDQLYRKALKEYRASRYDDCLLTIEQGFLLAQAYSLMDRPVTARFSNLRGCIHQARGEWRRAHHFFEVAVNLAGKWIHGPTPGKAIFEDMETYANNLQKARDYLGY